ncbi:MAG TPA: DUF1553 domain-containing protein [Pirellulaceae bacterium]|jgi:hypothetical protein|nr:DUF1553 domain-containing protein [Pirellulaceae bacterium]
MRRARPARFVAAIALASLVLSTAAFANEPTEKLRFNRDVRPILAQTCFACHGPDSASRKADLRMDQREAAVDSGALMPGEPDLSEAIRRVFSDDPEEVMPPPAIHKDLSAEQKETLKRWVAEGAEYEPHWSFIAPVKAPLPEVSNPAWSQNPIDRFVLARLESLGLQPNEEADRRTLARRVSYDLTGLPPDPALVESFVADQAEGAYERLVDKLLESQDWGEHRAHYWLDAARYGDTHGIHFDNYREMWSYREWVVRAYNANQPYDQFLVEQLAGDLLENPTLDQKIASGFNRCNITTNEGGVIQEEYKVLYARDRTETTSRVFMGLTAGCAVCHDHKFDPLSQKEFYELSAFFDNTTQPVMDGNRPDTPPIIVVPLTEDRERYAQLEGELAGAVAARDRFKNERRSEFDGWLTAGDRQLGDAPEWLAQLQPELSMDLDASDPTRLVFKRGDATIDASTTSAYLFTEGPSGSRALKTSPDYDVAIPAVGDFEKEQAFSYGAWVKLPPNAGGAIFSRMDEASAYRGWDLWVEGGKVGAHIISSWPENGIKVVSQQPVKANEWVHVAVSYDGSGKAAGVKVYVDGKPQPTNALTDALNGSIKTQVAWSLGRRTPGQRLEGLEIRGAFVYPIALDPQQALDLRTRETAARLLSKAPETLTDAEKNELYEWHLQYRTPEWRDLVAKVSSLEGEKKAVEDRGTIAHVMQEKPTPAIAFVLARGEYDQKKEEVKAGTPAMLPPMDEALPRNRLGLAKWLIEPDHPLTARVTANRYWQEVFGVGLVRTSEDFGISGELPANQELLDWLSVEFRESGWDVKKLFRLMLTSQAYRQSARVTPEKLAADPENRYLSRGPRFRMDAEMIRDTALATSGLLVRKIGGPSVRPYQPIGIWEAVAMPGSDTRNYVVGTGEDLYRRSVYTFLKRAAPPASLELFNATAREVCTVRRERTNTPIQALVTLNDPQFVEAARFLAEKAIKEGGASFEDRMQFAATRLISRPFEERELAIVRRSLDQLQVHYTAAPEQAEKLLATGAKPRDASIPAAEHAAWTMLMNQIMNLDEVLNQ